MKIRKNKKKYLFALLDLVVKIRFLFSGAGADKKEIRLLGKKIVSIRLRNT